MMDRVRVMVRVGLSFVRFRIRTTPRLILC
jgi:hypothetical protein